MRNLPRFSLIIALCAFLGGCFFSTPPAPRPYQIGMDGNVTILNSAMRFSPQRLPKGWVLVGGEDQNLFQSDTRYPAISQNSIAGLYGLRIESSDRDFLLARYTNTYLLVSPYLIWHWYVSRHYDTHHPVRLLIGLYGGAPDSPPLPSLELVSDGKGLPPYDRLISIGWDNTALKRGQGQFMGHAYYSTQRGGIEQTAQWHQEASDLLSLYKQAWPRDNIKNSRITFIGIASRAGEEAVGSYFAHIQLTR